MNNEMRFEGIREKMSDELEIDISAKRIYAITIEILKNSRVLTG